MLNPRKPLSLLRRAPISSHCPSSATLKSTTVQHMSTTSSVRAPFTVGTLDHVVLQCASVDRTVDWYTKYLGMNHSVLESATGPRHALAFGKQKLNLHDAAAPFKPHARTPVAGSADLCFILDGNDTTVETVKRYWEQNGLDIVEGVVEKTGAMGKIRSVYTRDPDGNLIEVSTYVGSG